MRRLSCSTRTARGLAVSIAVLTQVLGACGGEAEAPAPPAPEPPAAPQEPAPPADVPEEEPMDTAAPTDEAAASAEAEIYFNDDTDGGDDPMAAGCHWKYSDPQCTADKAFHNGDGCYNTRDLWEWTQQTCHGPQQDHKRYDCEEECQRRGHTTGSCVPKPNACGEGLASARCECVTI